MLFAAATGVHADMSEDEIAMLDADVKRYANAYACDEEPLAERLRSTVLLIVAGSGKSRADVVDARQRFLDGLRERSRAGGRSTPAECAEALSALRARLEALDRIRLAPAAPR